MSSFALIICQRIKQNKSMNKFNKNISVKLLKTIRCYCKKYHSKNLYYKKNSSKIFLSVLKKVDLRNLKVKKFYDIKYA